VSVGLPLPCSSKPDEERVTVLVPVRPKTSMPEYCVEKAEPLEPSHCPGRVGAFQGSNWEILTPRWLQRTLVPISLPSKASMPVAMLRPSWSMYSVLMGAAGWKTWRLRAQSPTEQLE